jgi:hypothetical protein
MKNFSIPAVRFRDFPDPRWDTPSLLSSGHRGLFPLEWCAWSAEFTAHLRLSLCIGRIFVGQMPLIHQFYCSYYDVTHCMCDRICSLRCWSSDVFVVRWDVASILRAKFYMSWRVSYINLTKKEWILMLRVYGSSILQSPCFDCFIYGVQRTCDGYTVLTLHASR